MNNKVHMSTNIKKWKSVRKVHETYETIMVLVTLKLTQTNNTAVEVNGGTEKTDDLHKLQVHFNTWVLINISNNVDIG